MDLAEIFHRDGAVSRTSILPVGGHCRRSPIRGTENLVFLSGMCFSLAAIISKTVHQIAFLDIQPLVSFECIPKMVWLIQFA